MTFFRLPSRLEADRGASEVLHGYRATHRTRPNVPRRRPTPSVRAPVDALTLQRFARVAGHRGSCQRRSQRARRTEPAPARKCPSQKSRCPPRRCRRRPPGRGCPRRKRGSMQHCAHAQSSIRALHEEVHSGARCLENSAQASNHQFLPGVCIVYDLPGLVKPGSIAPSDNTPTSGSSRRRLAPANVMI